LRKCTEGLTSASSLPIEITAEVEPQGKAASIKGTLESTLVGKFPFPVDNPESETFRKNENGY